MVFIIIGTGGFIPASQGLNSSNFSQENHQVINKVTALFQSTLKVIEFTLVYMPKIFSCDLMGNKNTRTQFAMQLNNFTKFFFVLTPLLSVSRLRGPHADRSNYHQGRWTVIKMKG